jgi:hypothetical protein
VGNGSHKKRVLNFTKTKDPTTVSQLNLLLCTAVPAAAAILVVAHMHDGRCHHPSLHRRECGAVTAAPLRPLAWLAFSATVELSFWQPLLPQKATRAAIRAAKAQRCHSNSVSQMRTGANAVTAPARAETSNGGKYEISFKVVLRFSPPPDTNPLTLPEKFPLNSLSLSNTHASPGPKVVLRFSPPPDTNPLTLPEKFPLNSLSLSNTHASPGPSPGCATPPDLVIDRGISMSGLEFGIILRGLLGMQDTRTVCPRNVHTVVGLLIHALSDAPTHSTTHTHTASHRKAPSLGQARGPSHSFSLWFKSMHDKNRDQMCSRTHPVNDWRRGERRAASRGPRLLICCVCADMRCKTNTRHQSVQTGHAQTGHARR